MELSLAPPDEMRQQAAGRSNCYGLLALLFRDTPTPEVVARLRTPPLADALRDFGYDAAEELAGEPEAVAERLREEYTRVFIGPGSHVSLYASVHRSEEGQLWSDSTVRLKRFVEATGLSFEGHWDGIPDHVAVELELMQRLTAHEAELWAQMEEAPACDKDNLSVKLTRCLEAEDEFLREHLCMWIPQFCGRVSDQATLLLYGKLAVLTETVVLSDAEQVAAALSAIRSSPSAGPGRRENA